MKVNPKPAPHLMLVARKISAKQVCVKPRQERLRTRAWLIILLFFKFSGGDFTFGKFDLMKAIGPGALSQDDLLSKNLKANSYNSIRQQ